MSREVKGIEEALEVLKKQKITWATVNRVRKSMWDTGVVFFGSNHHCFACCDDVHN
jgi:hypothetical protein